MVYRHCTQRQSRVTRNLAGAQIHPVRRNRCSKVLFFWLQDQKVHRYKRSSRQGTSWNQPLARTSLAPLASKTSEHHMFSQPTTADQGTANGKEGLKHASITTVQDTIKVQRTEVRMRTIKEHTREVNNAKTRIHADSRQVRRHNYIPCSQTQRQDFRHGIGTHAQHKLKIHTPGPQERLG